MAERLSDRLASGTSRRGFLARVGGAVLGLGGARTATALGAKVPDGHGPYNFCGHTYTTDNCPHPTGLPRIDARGLPLRARDGHPIDDLGRPVDRAGRPLDDAGDPLTDIDGRPLPNASRTAVCTVAGREHGFKPHIDGAWYRCCGGHVRKLVDCCAYTKTRINGDAALTGYCFKGRKVFCVTYYQTKVPC